MSQNNEWITKEKFNEVFPRGYRECNFFSPSIECWSMSKEDAFRNRERTALLDLSSYLKLQRKLQQTYSIGHSSDTKLLTELLNLKNNSLNNNINIPIDSSFIDSNKKCYTCNNVCKCSTLLPIRLKKHLIETNNKPLLSLSRIVLPEIQLIEKFDKSYIKSSVRKPNLKLPNNILDSNDVSVNNIGRANVSENGYDKIDIESDIINKNMYWENNDISILQTKTPPLNNRIGVIQCDTITESNDNISGFGSTNISENGCNIPEIERDSVNENIVWDGDDTLMLYSPEINDNVIERTTEQISRDDSTNDYNNDISITGFRSTNISENGCNTPEIECDSMFEDSVWDGDDTLMLYTPEINDNVIERTTEQIVQDDSTNDENNEYNKIIFEYFNLNSLHDIFPRSTR